MTEVRTLERCFVSCVTERKTAGKLSPLFIPGTLTGMGKCVIPDASSVWLFTLMMIVIGPTGPEIHK